MPWKQQWLPRKVLSHPSMPLLVLGETAVLKGKPPLLQVMSLHGASGWQVLLLSRAASRWLARHALPIQPCPQFDAALHPHPDMHARLLCLSAGDLHHPAAAKACSGHRALPPAQRVSADGAAQPCALGPHWRPTLPCIHQAWCLPLSRMTSQAAALPAKFRLAQQAQASRPRVLSRRAASPCRGHGEETGDFDRPRASGDDAEARAAGACWACRHRLWCCQKGWRRLPRSCWLRTARWMAPPWTAPLCR